MTFTKDNLQQFYRYSYALTCDEHSAFDLLQSALEKYLRIRKVPDYPTSYMKRIIHNQFIDDCRRSNMMPVESFDEEDLPMDINASTLENIIISSDMVDQIIKYLAPDEREILYFWALEGMTASEISDLLEIPRGTILSRIYRMRHKLIDEYGDGSSADAQGVLS